MYNSFGMHNMYMYMYTLHQMYMYTLHQILLSNSTIFQNFSVIVYVTYFLRVRIVFSILPNRTEYDFWHWFYDASCWLNAGEEMITVQLA